jgi:chaperonin GroES
MTAAVPEVKTLPVPTGYRLLVRLPEKKRKTEGGIHLPDERADREHTASIVGQVVVRGDDAYCDKERYPNGAWCQEGDWVLFRRYAGTRFKYRGEEWRLLNDDSVEAVVACPEEIEAL